MVERNRDKSTGQFAGEVTADDVVAAVRAHDPAATSEVGDELGVSRQAADRRLRRLRDDGRVSSKKIGASLVWFMPRTRETRERRAHDDPVAFDAADQRPPASARGSAATSGEESAGDGSPPQPPGDGGDRSTTPHGGESAGGEREPLDDVLAELPSTVDPDAARDAVLAAREFLEKRSRATKADFVRGIMRDHPLGYDPDAALAKLEAGERFRGAWWRRVIKPGLEAFDEVEKPPRGASDWRLASSEGDV